MQNKKTALPKVCVLMSTYNGEKYIKTQIDSILKQQDADITLMIRDDGSSDATCSILKEISAVNDNVLFYQGSNVRVGKSFMELIHKSPEADYYAFADQDDYWNPDKLSRAVKIIKLVERDPHTKQLKGKGEPIFASSLNPDENDKTDQAESAVPVLYGSNQTLVDGKLDYIGEHYEEDPPCDLYSCLTRNTIFGCTMVWNRELNDIMKSIRLPDDRVMLRKFHDSWLLYCAQINGVLVYDSESTMLYRQHEQNVVGGQALHGWSLIRDKYKRLTGAENKGLRSLLADNILDIFGDSVDDDVRKHLIVIKNANSPVGAVRLLKDEKVRPTLKESNLKIFLRCILRWI